MPDNLGAAEIELKSEAIAPMQLGRVNRPAGQQASVLSPMLGFHLGHVSRLHRWIAQGCLRLDAETISTYIHAIQTPFTYTHQKHRRADIIKRIRK